MNIIESQTVQIIRGDDVTLHITFTDQDNDPVDITGSEVFFTVKNKLADVDDDALIATSTTSHTTPDSGITSIVLTNTDTDINPGTYVYDLQLIDETDSVSSIIYGKFQIVDDVTKRLIQT